MNLKNIENSTLNICYIESQTDPNEFKYFFDNIINLRQEMSQFINLTVVAKTVKDENLKELRKRVRSVSIYSSIDQNSFLDNLKDIELGIIVSTDQFAILDPSIFFVANGIAVLCHENSGDSKLSSSKIFQYKTKQDFSDKLSAIINNKDLLKDYFDNLDEVTPQFVEECVKEHNINKNLFSNNLLSGRIR